jgi:hypothetical protein
VDDQQSPRLDSEDDASFQQPVDEGSDDRFDSNDVQELLPRSFDSSDKSGADGSSTRQSGDEDQPDRSFDSSDEVDSDNAHPRVEESQLSAKKR